METFQEVVQQYDVWIFLGCLSVGIAYLIYRIMVWALTRTPESAIERVREIANLSDEEIRELQKRNDPKLVLTLVDEAKETVQDWELHEEGEITDKKEIRALQNSLGVIPERYEDLKKGGRFSEYDPNKRLRDV